MEYKVEESYPIEVDNYSLAVKTYGNEAPTITELTWMLNLKPVIIRTIDILLEIKLTNGITIYKKEKDVTIIRKVAEKYL